MPVFRSKITGAAYRTENPVEITRYRMSAKYTEDGAEPPVTIEDVRFHPADHNIGDVAAYIRDNPEDAARVLAEEKAGKARATLLDGTAKPTES